MNKLRILIASVILSLPALAEEGKVVARVKQGIFETPIRWDEEMRFCRSDAVLESAADFLGSKLSEFRKQVTLEGLVESDELAIAVQHEDAAKARVLAGMIRSDYEQARIAFELGLMKATHSLELRRQKVDLDYLQVIAETNKRVLTNELLAKLANDESAMPSLAKVSQDEGLLAAKAIYDEGKIGLERERIELEAKIRAGISHLSLGKDDVTVEPTLEKDRLTFGKAMSAFEEVEMEADLFELLSVDESGGGDVANADLLTYDKALEALYETDLAIKGQAGIVRMSRKALVSMLGNDREGVTAEGYRTIKAEYEKERKILEAMKAEKAALYRKE